MAVKVNREEFLAKLQSVSVGLSRREEIEQSDAFCFKDGYIMTYNEEVACRMPSKLGNDFLGAVKAKPILNLLQKMKEEEIDIEVVEGELLIKGKGGRKAGVRTEQEILLAIATVEKPTGWKPLPDDFCDAIQLVSSCASTDASKFELTCVHIHPKWIEACDNSQLMRYKIKLGISESILVKHDSIKSIAALGVVKYSETDSWIHFKNGNGLIVSCRRHVTEFHDLSSIIKFSGVKAVLPKGLNEAIEAAEIFSSENTDDNKVLVDLTKGKLKLRGEGVMGWYSEPKKVQYDGPSMKFRIAPSLLRELTKKYNECEIGDEKLKVDGGRFVYVACLNAENDDNDKEHSSDDTSADSDDGSDGGEE